MIRGNGSGEGSCGYIGEYHPSNKNLATCAKPPHYETNIYFIQAHPDGLIKIGVAQNPYRRLATLQIGSPVPLILRAFQYGDSHSELGRHLEFARHHSHGEWFHPTPKLVAYVKKIGLPPMPVREVPDYEGPGATEEEDALLARLHAGINYAERRHPTSPPAKRILPIRQAIGSFAEFRESKRKRPAPPGRLHLGGDQ